MTDISAPYVNHVGSTRDSAGNIYAVITQDGAGDTNTDVLIRRCLATADPMIAQSWSEVYRYTERDFGKHGYGSGEVLNNGDFLAILSERNAAGDTVARAHRIPGLCPPWPPAGGDVYQAAPGGSIRVKHVSRADPPFSGEEIIALPASIPRDATLLQMSVFSAAERTGAPTYVNGYARISGSLAMYAQVAGARMTIEGWRAAGPDHTLYLAATNGALVEFYVDVLGWWI